MRVLVDTNVLFSAILFPDGVAAKSFAICAKEGWLVIPMYVIDELKDVVKRKCPSKMPDIDSFLMRMSYECVDAPDDIRDIPNIRDPKDRPILATGVKENVDVILSGDLDFKAVEMVSPRVLTPREFLEEFLSSLEEEE